MTQKVQADMFQVKNTHSKTGSVKFKKQQKSSMTHALYSKSSKVIHNSNRYEEENTPDNCVVYRYICNL